MVLLIFRRSCQLAARATATGRLGFWQLFKWTAAPILCNRIFQATGGSITVQYILYRFIFLGLFCAKLSKLRRSRVILCLMLFYCHVERTWKRNKRHDRLILYRNWTHSAASKLHSFTEELLRSASQLCHVPSLDPKATSGNSWPKQVIGRRLQNRNVFFLWHGWEVKDAVRDVLKC